MKKVFYESWIANHLLAGGYSTITLFAWVFTKYGKRRFPQRVMNHECVHARQWAELTAVSGGGLWIGMLAFGYSGWWLVCSVLTFYLWYVVEWAVKRCMCASSVEAYRKVSFEQEARMAEPDDDYLENGGYFEWLDFVF